MIHFNTNGNIFHTAAWRAAGAVAALAAAVLPGCTGCQPVTSVSMTDPSVTASASPAGIPNTSFSRSVPPAGKPGATGSKSALPAGKPAAPGGKPVIVVCVDISESTNYIREAQLDALDLATVKAIADDCPLSVWIYGGKAVQVYYGTPQTPDELQPIKQRYMKCGKTDDATLRGTRPGVQLQALIDDTKLSSASALHVCITSDGDEDDAKDVPGFNTAANILANRPGFKLCVVGMDPSNRTTWDKAFSACPAANVSLAGTEQSQQLLTSWLR